MSLADRIKTARNYLGKEQKEIAKLLDISFRSWQDYELGKSVPGGKVFEALARIGFNANWLLTGEGPMRRGEPAPAEQLSEHTAFPGEGFVQVPRYEIAASAGGGTLVHSEQIVDYMTFRADWLRTNLGMSPDHAAVISVAGDSMEPYLTNGDLILIDMGVERIENDSVYVLQFGDALQIKRVQKKSDGTVVVKSDNTRYEPEIFHNESAERLRVVGRLVRRLVI